MTVAASASGGKESRPGKIAGHVGHPVWGSTARAVSIRSLHRIACPSSPAVCRPQQDVACSACVVGSSLRSLKVSGGPQITKAKGAV